MTAPPYYPAWEVRQPYSAWRYRRETRQGVRIQRAPIYVPKKPSGLRRLLHHASFVLTGAAPTLASALRWRPHVVFAVAPSLMSAPTAALAARLAGARSWLHIQDFEVDAAFGLGLLRGTGARRLLQAAESSILRKFDHVSTISPQMCRRLVQKGVAPHKVEEVRNWVDTAAVVPGDRMTSYRQQLGIDEHKIVALYSGNMAAKQGLVHLGEAVTWLTGQREDIVFILCGSGPMRGPLEAAIGGYPNVRFIDLQPAARLPELLSTADIHLLPQMAAAADLVLPSKISGMLASGRPIVAMAEPHTGLFAEVGDAGVIVPPGNGQAFAAAIAALADDPGARTKLGEAARKAAMRRWDKSAIIDQIEQTLIALMASERR
jgi:colanic acid biosynthesis glycosyl transferase WcaI